MDDDHPHLEKQLGHKPLRRCAKVGENCNLVSIDCYSVWFGFVFGCVHKFDPPGNEAMSAAELAFRRSSECHPGAGYQRNCHNMVSRITTRAVIKPISAHKLSFRLSPLLSICMAMTSPTEASPSRLKALMNRKEH